MDQKKRGCIKIKKIKNRLIFLFIVIVGFIIFLILFSQNLISQDQTKTPNLDTNTVIKLGQKDAEMENSDFVNNRIVPNLYMPDKLNRFINSSNKIDQDQNSISFELSNSESCFECHETFIPFEVEVEVPKSVEPGKNFDYNVKVKNTDSETPHTVENLEMKLIGIGETPNDPYNEKIEESIRRQQVDKLTIPVEQSASNIAIVLSGDSSILGINNLDLFLTSPNGHVWESKNDGLEEEIILNHNDILKGGFGKYSIEIHYIRGLGPISYSLTIEVLYYSPELQKFGEDLQPNDSYTFSWTLSLTAEELENLGGEVSGMVIYKHEGGREEGYKYTIKIHSDVVKLTNEKTSINYFLENGRIIGLFTLIIFILIIINGFSKTSRTFVAKRLKIKNTQNVHCLFSLTIILFAIIHASLLIMGPYTWNATPNIYGAGALIIFGTLGITGFYRYSLITKIGNKNWKHFHRFLTVLVLIIVVYHILTFGGHFN